MTCICASFVTYIFTKTFFFLFYCLCFCLLFVAVCACLFHLRTSRKVSQWKKANIPFIQPALFVGSEHFRDLREKSTVCVADKMYHEYADKTLVAYFLAWVPFVLLRDPKLIKKVYAKSSDKMFVSGFFPLKTDIETQSVTFLASDRNQWKTSRSVMSPFLATSRMRGPFSKIKFEIDKLWRYSEETRLKGQPTDLKKFAYNFVADSFASWGFSEHTNSYERDEELHEVVHYFFGQNIARAAFLFIQMQVPWLQNFNWFKFIPPKYLDFIKGLLRRKMAERREEKTFHDDVVDYFMSLEGNDDDGGSGQKGINLRQMTGYSLSILLGGTDTTSQLSMFSVHLLSLHPEYQVRIKTEIDDVMKRHGVAELTFEVIQDLQFTEQCIMETARLYPYFPLILRICLEDFQIPGTTYSLRKGERVVINPYAMQRDPKYFKDPDKFDPERFSPENRNSIPLDVFINFGVGPRKCPGYLIGILLAVTFAASLVSKYEIRPRSHLHQMTSSDIDPKGFLIFPKEELLVDLIPRQRLI